MTFLPRALVLLLCLGGNGMAAAHTQTEAAAPLPAAEASAGIPAAMEQKLLAAASPETDRGISGHEPTYIVFGGNWRGEGDYGAKFQVSLKFRMLNPDQPESTDWWERFYFAYTQKSVWDLEAESAPFRDSSYKPEMFWDHPTFSPLPSIATLAGLRLGFGHESNGKDGADSRSINIAYVRPVFTFPSTKSGFIWSFSPKLYGYIDRADNPDIADYRGFGDFNFKLRKDDTWEFSALLRKGTQRDYGSVQLEASYPFRGFLRQLNGYLYMQYFNGYGETILDYNRRLPSHVGIGLIVVR
jgi:outer membrane phospholipase A